MEAKAYHPDVLHDPYGYLSTASGPGELSEAMGGMSLGDDTAAFTGTQSSGSYASTQAHAGGHGMYAAPQAMAVMYTTNGTAVGQPIFGIAQAPTTAAMIPYNQQVLMVAPIATPQYGMGSYGYDFDQYGHGSYNHGRSRGGYHHRGNYSQRQIMGSSDHEHIDHHSKKSENIVKIERISAGLDVRTTVSPPASTSLTLLT